MVSEPGPCWHASASAEVVIRDRGGLSLLSAVVPGVRGLNRVTPPLSFDPIAEARRQWRKRWGSGPEPAMGAVTSIMRVQQILIARLNNLLRPWELTFPRYEALMLLYFSRTGSLPLGKMGARLQVHPTSVTNTVDGLERLGFVERTRHERDRRTTLATITDSGRAAAEAATEVLNRARFGTEPLKKTELDTLYATLLELRVHADESGG